MNDLRSLLTGRTWTDILVGHDFMDVTTMFIYTGESENTKTALYNTITGYDERRFRVWLSIVASNLMDNQLDDSWFHQQEFNLQLSDIDRARITVCLSLPCDPVPDSVNRCIKIGFNIETN